MMEFWNWWFWPFMAAGMFLVIVVGLIVFVFWIWMIIDCIQRKFKNDTEKIIWIIVIILASWIGALVYFIAVRNMNPRGISKK